ncbi:methylated-DNA--[protein]-cysteine S-methyltransferase [Plantibacter sp. YIM 135347]|uniref:methylated-DNA--[protein]-cysteine S-methyltransferase n=1 Tax=Plantibacter sp. YIM 135347 TaxID=3423919 RepID=UPI003D33C53E
MTTNSTTTTSTITAATPPQTPDLLTSFVRMPSPIGRLQLVSDGHVLTSVSIEQNGDLPFDGLDERPDELLLGAVDELEAYFSGDPAGFSVPIGPAGTPFQQAVWRELAAVPFGTTTSYGNLAMAAGAPLGGRAAGQAVRANPVAVLIPCHRVLASGGRLTPYAGVNRSGGNGPATKEWLLAHEGIEYRT